MMSFLNPWLLLGLPLILLPIIIHLLNQRRHRTAPWAATIFVKMASSLNRGNARLRQWLTLLLRTVAIGAIVLALSRPLTSLGTGLSMLATGRQQIILVDRSPSMAHTKIGTGLSQRANLLGQLDELLDNTQSRSNRWLIESHRQTPTSMGTDSLLSISDTQVSAVSTDVPALIEAALDKIETDTPGPADIWLSTDLQAADWQTESGRWNRIDRRLKQLPSTRLRVLSPPPADSLNLAISASNIRTRTASGRRYLELDLTIQQTHGEVTKRQVPVVVRVGTEERRLDADMVSDRYHAQAIRVELADENPVGGGVVELPDDANTADNRFYFAYAPPPPRHTVVVSDDEDVRSLIEAVCLTPRDENIEHRCDLLSPKQTSELNWSDASLIVWHAELPKGDIADRLESFVDSGRIVLFLPPATISADQTTRFGLRWDQWETFPEDQSNSGADQTSEIEPGYRVVSWRKDDDLLATDPDGRELPVDRLICRRRCKIQPSDATVLAAFSDGPPLLLRSATKQGGAYFLATLPTANAANFLDDGILLYVLLQRSLVSGATANNQAQSVTAGQLADGDTRQWKPVDAQSTAILPSDRPFQTGLYETQGRLLAVNRSLTEDSPERIDRATIAQLLNEDAFDLITVGGPQSGPRGLVSEVWRGFVVLLIAALLGEGWLSLPNPRSRRRPSMTESAMTESAMTESSMAKSTMTATSTGDRQRSTQPDKTPAHQEVN